MVLTLLIERLRLSAAFTSYLRTSPTGQSSIFVDAIARASIQHTVSCRNVYNLKRNSCYVQFAIWN